MSNQFLEELRFLSLEIDKAVQEVKSFAEQAGIDYFKVTDSKGGMVIAPLLITKAEVLIAMRKYADE